MSPKYQAQKKIDVLLKIREYKEILFGSFSAKLTKNDKALKWKIINDLAKKYSLLPANKDWSYMRDTYWQNTKKCALTKLEDSKQYGAVRLTKVDELVLDILGKRPPNAAALCLPNENTTELEECISYTSMRPKEDLSHENPDTTEELQIPKQETKEISSNFDAAVSLQDTMESDNFSHATKECMQPKWFMSSNDEVDNEKDFILLRKRKLELINEHLELQNRYTKLKILKLEKDLGLSK